MLKNVVPKFFVMFVLAFFALTVIFVFSLFNQPSCCSPRTKSRVEEKNINYINDYIMQYKIDTGFWPEFPNMESLLTSSTYFPDGIPRDPFTNESKLGTYSLDIRQATLHMHVYSEPHTTGTGLHNGYCSQSECP